MPPSVLRDRGLGLQSMRSLQGEAMPPSVFGGRGVGLHAATEVAGTWKHRNRSRATLSLRLDVTHVALSPCKI